MTTATVAGVGRFSQGIGIGMGLGVENVHLLLLLMIGKVMKDVLSMFLVR